MAPHIYIDVSAKSAQGWIHGGAILGHWGTPSLKEIFRQEGYSNKLNAYQLSRSNSEEVLLFLFPLRRQILKRFYVFLVYFNAISIDIVIDGVLSINYPDFENYLGKMCPHNLEIKHKAESNTSDSYLNLQLSIGRDGQLHTSLYYKREDF